MASWTLGGRKYPQMASGRSVAGNILAGAPRGDGDGLCGARWPKISAGAAQGDLDGVWGAQWPEISAAGAARGDVDGSWTLGGRKYPQGLHEATEMASVVLGG